MSAEHQTPDDVDEGDELTVEYTTEAAMERTHRTMDGLTVREQMGNTVYLETPFDDDTLELVLDSDSYLWAREAGSPSTDALFGSNAHILNE